MRTFLQRFERGGGIFSPGPPATIDSSHPLQPHFPQWQDDHDQRALLWNTNKKETIPSKVMSVILDSSSSSS